MYNILTVAEELLTEHIDEQFEISELLDLPNVQIAVFNGSVGVGGINDEQAQVVLERYKFRELLPILGIDLVLMGYLHQGEFLVYSVMLRSEGKEMTPERRASFMELFNLNEHGVKLRHVPVNPMAMTLDGAKKALTVQKLPLADVIKYTVHSLTELVEGVSPLTKEARKGLVFKSTTSDFSFKVLSEKCLIEETL